MCYRRISSLAWGSFLLAVIPLAQGQIFAAQPNPIVSVAITSALGDTITFRLSPVTGVVQGIDARVLGIRYSVPLARCLPLKNIRFETVAFMLIPIGHDTRKEGTFGFVFSMGTEKDRRFGVLPRIQMGFYKAQFVDPLISSQTGPRSSFASSLCPGVPIEVPR